MGVKNEPAFESTGDGVFDLIAAVQRRAILDAVRGCDEAIAYLDVTMPDWRTHCRRIRIQSSPAGERRRR